MDAPHRGALMLVRFIAVALLGFGLIEFTLSWLEDSSRHQSLRLADFVIPSILFVLGIIGLVKANSLAGWLSDKLDG